MWHDKNKKHKKWPKKLTSKVTFHKLELATPRNCTEDTCSKIAENIDNLDIDNIDKICNFTGNDPYHRQSWKFLKIL